MLEPYRDALRTPGSARFSFAGWIGRLPISMIGLGIVLLVTSEGGSYAIAGTMSAAFAVAAAVGGPILSGFVDRHGQHRVLPYAAGLQSAAMLGLIVALDRQVPLVVSLPLAVMTGLTFPSLGSLVRARWAFVLPRREQINVAYAWESILDEIVFVVGPPLATILALRVHPTAALVVCVVLLLVGTGLLIPQRATEPPPHGSARRSGRPAVFSPGMPFLVLIFILVGGVFGSFEVVTVAYAQEKNAESATGVLLAIYAAGSLLAGLAYGIMRPPDLHSRRHVAMLTLMMIVTLGFPLSPNVMVLTPVAFLAGISVSPVLISGTALVERLVPSEQLTEGITWSVTGLALGVGLAAPVSGVVIDNAGSQAAYLITAGCAATACLIGWIARPTIVRAEQRALAIIAAKEETA